MKDPVAFAIVGLTEEEQAEATDQQRHANGADGPHTNSTDVPTEICLDNFHAYMPMHCYIFTPTGELWPASSVNARLPPVDIGTDKPMPASAWLDQHNAGRADDLGAGRCRC